MAKFINNSAISTIARRAAAEGILISKIIEGIKTASEKRMVTSGHYESLGDSSCTNEKMAEKISALESYGGGYMYGGEYAVVVGGADSFHYCCHSVHDYDTRHEVEFFEHNLKVVSGLMEGAEIKIGCSSDQSSWDIYLYTGEVWEHTHGFDGREYGMDSQSMLYNGCVLYSGIRADVAKECGYDLNDGFHWAFDQAVTAIYS